MTILHSLENSRLYYLDYLRAFCILLVIIFHTAITYAKTPIFALFIHDHHSNSITMIIWILYYLGTTTFFFIAGYFSWNSLLHKSSTQFIIDKLLHLLLPILLACFVLNPLTIYIAGQSTYTSLWTTLWHSFSHFLNSYKNIRTHAHIWFIESLFWFCMILAILSSIIKQKFIAKKNQYSKLPSLSFLLFFLAICFAAFVILLFLNRKFGGSYIMLPLWSGPTKFIIICFLYYLLGCYARQQQWLISWPTQDRRYLIFAAVGFFIIVLNAWLLTYQGYKFQPAWLAQLIFIIFTLIGYLGALLGFLSLSARYNRPNPWLQTIASNSFCIYIFHYLVLVGLQRLFLNAAISPYFKIAFITGLTVTICFCLAEYVLKPFPVFNRIFW